MRGSVVTGPGVKGLSGMKCTVCKAPAGIRLPSHNSKFCDPCFDKFFLNGVAKGLKMVGFPPDTPLVVAVSGGKDSLAVWDALNRLGYKTLGLHLDLGLGEFSAVSSSAVEKFAADKGLSFRIFRLEDIFGHSLEEAARAARMAFCSVCGTLKRFYINSLTVEAGFSAVATGHHLDDEAGRLMGNLIRHKDQYLEKFYPYLPSVHPAQASRIKPLFRLDQHEIRAYCRTREIVPAQGEGCPFAKGATSHYFQEALEFLEEKMPGTKRDFLFSFLRSKEPPREETFGTCQTCGQPTYGQQCGVCRLKERMLKSSKHPKD